MSPAPFRGREFYSRAWFPLPRGKQIQGLFCFWLKTQQAVASDPFTTPHMSFCFASFCFVFDTDDVCFSPFYKFISQLWVFGTTGMLQNGATQLLLEEKSGDEVVRCHKSARLRRDGSLWKNVASYLLLTPAMEDSALSKWTLWTRAYSRRHQYQREFCVHPWVRAVGVLATNSV